ncbi:hypothetical protein HZB93_01145 [Candidatus Falkowbacteria bacterium]|nr:hypothetical protein [Candidatus Falkowbacteria bacterium]
MRQEELMTCDWSELIGAIVLLLIALEGAVKILTGEFRVFKFLGRQAKKLLKWLWRKFWRLIRWLARMVWRGLCRLGRRPPPQQPPRQNRPNP